MAIRFKKFQETLRRFKGSMSYSMRSTGESGIFVGDKTGKSKTFWIDLSRQVIFMELTGKWVGQFESLLSDFLRENETA